MLLLLYKNVAQSIERTKVRKKKKRALTSNEKNHLETAEFDDLEKLLAYLLLYTGIRRQEVIPLTRFDVNFTKDKISINKAVKFVGEKAILKDTKSYSGEREIYILEPLKPLLKRHISQLSGTTPISRNRQRIHDKITIPKFI